jgi:hypothetical protein
MFTFLHQTDKFIITGDMAAQTFWQWSDDIKPKDDITPFDGTSKNSPNFLRPFAALYLA